MYVYRIIFFALCLLLTAFHVSAQTHSDSVVSAAPDTAKPLAPPEQFDVNGTKINDSTIAFGTDTVLKADTLHKGPKHTAMKAVWRSAVLPGLGQAYNRKYWKIPIIYVGFGGLGYALWYTSTNFNRARTAYRAVVRSLPIPPIKGSPSGTYLGYTDADDIKYFRDQYKNYLNISALVTVVWYGLQLVDAAVDGHLYNYNMDDKLSFNFDPSFLLHNDLGISQTCLGLTFTLKPLAPKQKTNKFIF